MTPRILTRTPRIHSRREDVPSRLRRTLLPRREITVVLVPAILGMLLLLVPLALGWVITPWQGGEVPQDSWMAPVQDFLVQMGIVQEVAEPFPEPDGFIPLQLLLWAALSVAIVPPLLDWVARRRRQRRTAAPGQEKKPQRTVRERLKGLRDWVRVHLRLVGMRYEYLRLRYDLKREYFTIGIPVIVAVLIVLLPLAMGWVVMPARETPKVDPRLAEYYAMVEAMGEEAGALPPELVATLQKGFIPLDQLVILATLVAITPYAFDLVVIRRRLRRKEELFAELLFKLSELMRGGLDPVKAVTELSKTELGELTPHIRLAATGMAFNRTFEETMRTMAASLKSELISRYTELVIQASTSGGSVADLILRASEDMRSIIGIEREKEGNLSQYTFIFYFAQGMLVFIAFTLSTSLLGYVQALGAETIFGTNEIANLNFRQGFFHLLMINSFLGGLIIGKITEGEARFGLKHAVVLMTACWIACAIFILPVPVVEGPAVNLTVISGGGQTGLPNVPLKDPLVFLVTDPGGEPQKRVPVSFTIEPGGKVSPSTDNTNERGEAQVRVVLGENAGTYTVTARAYAATVSVKVSTSPEYEGGG